MSQVIDTKVVEMQFDNSKFEKNIQMSLNSLQLLNKNVEDAGKNRNSLDELAKAGDQVGFSFDNMSQKTRITVGLMDLLAGVGTKAFNKISDAVAGFAMNMANSLSGMQAMRDGFAEYELKMGSVQTILNGAKILDENGNNIEDNARRLDIVNQKLGELNTYSDKTIYSFKDMTSNIGKFTNAGVSLDDAVGAIQGVANVAAVSGANANEASRAMYNFSQALSSGAVKLIDWKSIENANMATVEFKQQLLDTALALGTVVKEGDMYKTTTTDAKGSTSDLFNATTKFNDALGNQWMTTEVLTQTLKNYSTDVREMSAAEVEAYKAQLKSVGYTDKQIDGIVKLSKKAFEAATEVKTFSQMIDTLKESLGSGWAQTWETIFGDFEESKKLWTGLNNAIDGILSPIGKARNAILEVWKADGGRQAMIDSFKNLYQAVKNLFAPIKELWKALTPNTSNTGKILSTITKGIEKLTALIAKAASIVGKVLATILRPVIFIGNFVGKQIIKFVGLIRSAFSKIIAFFSPIGQAIKTIATTFTEAFDKHIVSRVKTLQSALAKFFNNLKTHVKNNAAIQKLSNAFITLKNVVQDLFGRVLRNASFYASGFVAYLGRIWHAVEPLISSALTRVLKSLAEFLLPKLEKALGWVADKVKKLGELIGKINFKNTAFYKGLSELPKKLASFTDSKAFGKLKSFANTIKDFGRDAVVYLSDKFQKLKADIEAIKMPSGLSDVFANIKNFIKSIFGSDSVKDTLTDGLSKATDAIGEMGDAGADGKFTAFQKFLKGLSDAFDWLKNAATKAKNAISDFVGFVKANTPKAFAALYKFMAGDDGILSMRDIADVIDQVSYSMSTLMSAFGVEQFGKAASNMSEALGETANAFTTFLKRTSNKMNMEAVRDFAIAMGITVGALYILSKIPADKLAVASSALIGIGFALTKFFGILSNNKMDWSKTVGLVGIAALLLSIGAAMIGVALSVGILVAALAVFPKVIKQYNNLGDDFRSGMDKVKEVLEEIFSYLDHLSNAKHGFSGAFALLGLVTALALMRRTIEKYASKETGKAMEEGLSRIKQVMELLADFFDELSTFTLINIGINLNTVGMALMILAIGRLLDKIVDPVKKFAKLTPSEFKKGFKGVHKIFKDLEFFLVALTGMAIVSKLTGSGLGQWLGMAANIAIIASTISSIVGSLKIMTDLAGKDEDAFKTAIKALRGIFIELGAVLVIVGLFKPKTSIPTLFSLSLCIGLLTACVVALVPLAKNHPNELIGAVIALGSLMLAFGGTLLLIGLASGKTTIGDIVKLIAVTLAVTLLAQTIRQLARHGGDAGSIVAAGAAISVAALAIAGAMKILGSIKMINPLVLVGLAILAAAIWGVAAAIAAFKSSSGGMTEGANNVSTGMEQMENSMKEGTENMSAFALDAMPPLIKELGASMGDALKEAFGNIDIGQSIRNMIETIKTDAKNWAQDFIDIGTNLVDGIAVALENPANIEKIKGSMKALGQALVDAFKSFLGINSPSTVMIEQGGYIIDGLVQGLMEYPAKLAEWVTGIGTYIKDGISGFFTDVVTKGKELVDNLGTGIQNGKEAVKKKAGELGQAALQKVGEAKAWAKNAGHAVTAFGNKLRSSKNPVKSAAGSMLIGATNAVSGLAKSYKTTASTAASTFSSQIKAGASPAKAAAKAIVTSAKAAFHGIASSWRGLGSDAAQGFRNGINAWVSKVAAKAAEMVRAAKNAAKKEQNSNSPSKDFMEFGGWAAQGYALGLMNRRDTSLVERNAQLMVDKAKGVVSRARFGTGSLYFDSNSALGSLAYAMAQISDSIDDNMDSSPTIRPIMDMSNVNRNASLISGMFGDKNFKANLEAAGFVQGNLSSTMARRNAAMSTKSIDELSNRLDVLTSAMNSRTMNNYITVDGAEDPQLFADKLVRSMRLNARTI